MELTMKAMFRFFLLMPLIAGFSMIVQAQPKPILEEKSKTG
jgi:hypothetical protein